MYKLSIIIPTYNEALNIDKLVNCLVATLKYEAFTYELVFVDDDSSDGTIQKINFNESLNNNIRHILRINRKGLSSAICEGIVSCTSNYQIVIDADLQHDLTKIPELYRLLDSGYDLVACSRDFTAEVGISESRKRLSLIGNWLLNITLANKVSDPLTGYFGIRNEFFNVIVRELNPRGFKIFYEILTFAKFQKVGEVTALFSRRNAGKSKLNSNIIFDTIELVAERTLGKYIPVKFLFFCAAGALGAAFHITILWISMTKLGIQFVYGQIFATYLAMILNFYNNYFITYRNVHIPNSFVKNLMRFMVICSVGAWLNVFSAFYLNNLAVEWQVAGIFGVFVGSVWNYSISRYVIWKI